MGSTQSIQEQEEEEEDEEEEDEDAEEDNGGDANRRLEEEDEEEEEDGKLEMMMKKVLEQEPEMLPYHASASPLSPQPSSVGTPLAAAAAALPSPSIKVWDPYNVLAPPPPPLSVDEVFLISHAQSHLHLRPDLLSGRSPHAALTPAGNRQARALAVFLSSSGVRFTSVYSSPLDRARFVAISVCQEMNFAEEQIQLSEAITEMSQGHWEGCHRTEVYSAEVLRLMDSVQPDFAPPSGESLREVEFRMINFLNSTVLGLPDKLRQMDNNFQNPHHHQDRDGPSLVAPHWDALQRSRAPPPLRKRSGKSRLQFMTTTGDHHDSAEDEISHQEHNHLHDLRGRGGGSSYAASCVGVFSHAVPIKCLLTGILGCSPTMANKLCVDDSSVTVLQHSWKTGWQIKKLNDTAHLRLL